jgi:hypothetical protein
MRQSFTENTSSREKQDMSNQSFAPGALSLSWKQTVVHFDRVNHSFRNKSQSLGLEFM